MKRKYSDIPCAECGLHHRLVCHWGEDIPEAGLVAHEFKPGNAE